MAYRANQERARLNILQALEDRTAVSEASAIETYELDKTVGDIARYADTSNYKIVQTLLREGLIGLDTATPMRIWITSFGHTYLAKANLTI